VVVLNKSDLCDDVAKRVSQAASLESTAPVHAVSAITGEDIDDLRGYLGAGQTVAFLGSSGVGKSALINALLGEARQVVGEVRARDGQGQHTTTVRELILLPGGGMVIDTPGMRELQLWVDEESLRCAFSDLEELRSECKFRDCRHETEPGCAVRRAVEDGRLDVGRLESFLTLRKEVEYLERRQDQCASQIERDKVRPIRLAARRLRKRRHEEGRF
jgi:ribosome biogenesis GTPase